ncbi:MAG: hypothetical protein DRN30_04560, partial [Thermoplasmata archaeon]
MYNQVNSNLFHSKVSEAISTRKRVGSELDAYDKSDYENMNTFLHQDGKSGYAVKADGELVSVFSSEKGRGHGLMEHALSQGAAHGNATDGYLTSFYEKHGAKEYKRDANWEPGGPDIVYFKFPKKGVDVSKAEDAEETRDVEDVEKRFHPAIDGGSHFILSPENPAAENVSNMTPDEVLDHIRSLGETVEDTYGKYGKIERSFIIHDPQHVDKLHNLASRLGQESAIISHDGIHEMHYYHGEHAGKYRVGKGTTTSDAQPDDNYTKITDHEGNNTFFSHNFDFDDKSLKSKIQKHEVSEKILKSLKKYSTDRFRFQKYWHMILGDLTDNSLEKALRIRTDDRVFVSMDGDNIGASVERAAMADDLETIIHQSETIMAGQKIIRQWASRNDADIYIDGGDDMAFTLPAAAIDGIESMRREYHEKTGFTVTVGIGESISRAGHAMLFGKLKGKNQINE